MLRKLLVLTCLLPVAGLAADGDAVPFTGRPVVEVIDEYRAAGVPFAYSTSLVPADLVVTIEPQASGPVEIMREILRPHGPGCQISVTCPSPSGRDSGQ